MVTSEEKVKLIQAKIFKAQQRLTLLKSKRQKEIGQIAVKAGLEYVDNLVLKNYFEKVAKELSHVHIK